MDDRSGQSPRSSSSVLELDHVFEALAHPRRRYVLYSLGEENQWCLWELAARVAAWENGVSPKQVDEAVVERTYVSLYHNHVPKLADDDIIEFREADETVLAEANAEQALHILDHAGGCDDSTQETHARRHRHDRRL